MTAPNPATPPTVGAVAAVEALVDVLSHHIQAATRAPLPDCRVAASESLRALARPRDRAALVAWLTAAGIATQWTIPWPYTVDVSTLNHELFRLDGGAS